jgi:hypothetical protein
VEECRFALGEAEELVVVVEVPDFVLEDGANANSEDSEEEG